jgi:hypothetical protein
VIAASVIVGNPDPAHVSTSYAQRQNLIMRMHMRRFTPLTNAFLKKFDNHQHARLRFFLVQLGSRTQGASADSSYGGGT